MYVCICIYIYYMLFRYIVVVISLSSSMYILNKMWQICHFSFFNFYITLAVFYSQNGSV